MRLAILSNTNLDYVIRMAGRKHEVYMAEGYGNEIGTLLDKSSSYYAFDPELTFVIIDIMELINHDTNMNTAKRKIENWFDKFLICIEAGKIYYISDAVIVGQEIALLSASIHEQILRIWNSRLLELTERYSNIRVFPYSDIIFEIGYGKAFSYKTWYMGKILLGMETQKMVVNRMFHIVNIETRSPKKVLILDLDNTLWGGLAGEHDITPIELSDEHSGLIFKNCQRIIKLMKQNGVLLAIASKNNEADATNLLDNHPHMILRTSDFVVKRINWNNKDVSIREIASELNLGTDSFVFWDDSPAERELIKQTMPEVAVPDFPKNTEDMPSALVQVYHTYFEKAFLTQEDKDKTKQYAANAKRSELKQSSSNFKEYLSQLEIVVKREDSYRNKERVTQLINKTNQFNLTTKRYSEMEVSHLLDSDSDRIFSYRVIDKFGDNGIVGVVIASVNFDSHTAKIETFVMSCRVMGRLIEYAILSDVEYQLREMQIQEIIGQYIPSEKNMPVKDFYTKAGYNKSENAGEYRLSIEKKPVHDFVAVIEK